MKRRVLLLAATAALVTAACNFGAQQVSVTQLSIAPPSLLVATKSKLVAWVVIDNSLLPDVLDVLSEGKPTASKVSDAQEFARRDLVRVFRNYFSEVKTATPSTVPSDAQVIILPKIDRIEVVTTGRRKDGMIERRSGAAKLTWGVGIRLKGSADFLFSFAGESVGDSTEDAAFMVRSMFESAITNFLAAYSDKKVHNQILGVEDEVLQSAPQTAPQPAVPSPDPGDCKGANCPNTARHGTHSHL